MARGKRRGKRKDENDKSTDQVLYIMYVLLKDEKMYICIE